MIMVFMASILCQTGPPEAFHPAHRLPAFGWAVFPGAVITSTRPFTTVSGEAPARATRRIDREAD